MRPAAKALWSARGYVVAVSLVAAATVFCAQWRHTWGGQAPLLAYALATALSAILYGPWPALLATTLGALVVVYLFMVPLAGLSIAQSVDQAHLLLFVANGGLMALAAAHVQRLRGLMTVFVNDLAEQRSVQRALRESEGRFRRFWDANIIGVCLADGHGNVHQANDAFLRMVGYTREEMVEEGLRWSERTPPEFLALDFHGIAEAMERGACTPYEKVYVTRDGRRVPVLIGYALLEGSRSDFICFVLDLTQQKRAEAALADQITSSITENASAALFMVDEEGHCTFMNPAAEAMTGFSFAEVEHRELHALIHHHHLDGRPFPFEECALKRVALLCGSPLEVQETTYFRKSGEPFPALCSARRVERPGRPPAVLLEIRDITGLKRAAAERELLLESERAARTEAERANRAKDEFVAMLSHELRTPLNAVLGWTELARRPEQRERALAVVERNARLLGQIISDLLDVTRIASGKLHVELGPVDLAVAVRAAIDAVRAGADAKGVALREAIDARDAIVLGDGPRLQQIVWNLISNAIKFTPRGGQVEVSLAAAGDRFRIVVSDTGRGIDRVFLPQLFERFRQADMSTSRAHGGLGLGLSIVKHLVDLHGGSVSADSDGPGKGARFTVELPREVERPSPTPIAAATTGLSKLAGARVLIVDDEADANELVRRLLEEHGASVVTASSAQEALGVLDAREVDVMISDIGMPGMDGYELMRRVRDGNHARHVPAVALTAYARPDDRARALSVGYQAHMAKPVEPTRMLSAVAGLLEERRAPEPR